MDLTPEYLNLQAFFAMNNLFNNDHFKNKFKGILQNAKEQAKKQIQESLKAQSFTQALQILNSNSPDSGVCSAKITNHQICWTCQDCQVHQNSIICQKCFEMGNHKGHKVLLKRFCEGCCDCGDSSFWKVEGNCSLHNGANIDSLKHPPSMDSLYNIFSELISSVMNKIVTILNDPLLFPSFKSPDSFPYQLLQLTQLLNYLQEHNLFCCQIAIEILASTCEAHKCNYLNAFLKNYFRLPQLLKHVSNIFLYPLLRSLNFKKLYGQALIYNFQNMIIYASNIDAFDNFGVQVAPIYEVSCDWGLRFITKAVDTFAFAFQVFKQQSGKVQPQHIFHYWSMYMRFYLQHKQNRQLFVQSEEFPRFLLYCSYLDFFNVYKKQTGPFPLTFYEENLNLGFLDSHHSLQKIIVTCLAQINTQDESIIPAFKQSYRSVWKLRRQLKKLDSSVEILRSPNLFSLRMAGHIFCTATVISEINASFAKYDYSQICSSELQFVASCRNAFQQLSSKCTEEQTSSELNFFLEAFISSKFSAQMESRQWLNLGYNFQRYNKLYSQSFRGYDLPPFKQDLALFQLNFLFSPANGTITYILNTLNSLLDLQQHHSPQKAIEEAEIFLHRIINCFCNPKPLFMMLPTFHSLKPTQKLQQFLRDMIKVEIIHLMSITPNKATTFAQIVRTFDSGLSALPFFENEIMKYLKVEMKREEKYYSLKKVEMVDPYYFHLLKITIDYQVAHPSTKLGNLSSRGSDKRCVLWDLPFFKEMRAVAACFDRSFLWTIFKLISSKYFSEGIKL